MGLEWRKQKGLLLGGPVAKTPSSPCRRPTFDPWSGNQIPHATTKILHAASTDLLCRKKTQPTKTRCRQINKIKVNIYFFKKERKQEPKVRPEMLSKCLSRKWMKKQTLVFKMCFTRFSRALQDFYMLCISYRWEKSLDSSSPQNVISRLCRLKKAPCPSIAKEETSGCVKRRPCILSTLSPWGWIHTAESEVEQIKLILWLHSEGCGADRPLHLQGWRDGNQSETEEPQSIQRGWEVYLTQHVE